MAVKRMLASFASVFTTITAGLAVAAPAAPQTGADGPAIEPITGLPLPVLEGEKLARLKDGCHAIVDPNTSVEEVAAYARHQWLGACPFGLANGDGLFTPGTGSLSKFRYGRPQLDHMEVFRKGRLRDTEWSFLIFDTPEQARAWWDSRRQVPEYSSDLSWSVVVATVSKSASSEVPAEDLWIEVVHKPCLKGSTKSSIAQSFIDLLGMSPANASLLAPFCEAALARLRRERPDLESPWEWEPYKTLPWGYYHSVRVRRAKGEMVGTNKWNEETLVCPRPGSSSSCAEIVRPILAPFLLIRDAERNREGEAQNSREKMISALEAAFAEKRRLRAAKASARRP